MIVGACPAPIAVLIFVLYASFWKVVSLICWSGWALLKASTAPARTPSCGWPLRYQYVAPPLLLPGPDEPQAASAADTGTPAARVRRVRRESAMSFSALESHRLLVSRGERFSKRAVSELCSCKLGFGVRRCQGVCTHGLLGASKR